MPGPFQLPEGVDPEFKGKTAEELEKETRDFIKRDEEEEFYDNTSEVETRYNKERDDPGEDE